MKKCTSEFVVKLYPSFYMYFKRKYLTIHIHRKIVQGKNDNLKISLKKKKKKKDEFKGQKKQRRLDSLNVNHNYALK